MKLPVSSSSTEYASADTMIIDESGIDLFIDGELELGGSFEALNPFQVSYAVLPEHFDFTGVEEDAAFEAEVAGACRKEQLEAFIWVYSQELARRNGYAR